jgi:hypothetical protein
VDEDDTARGDSGAINLIIQPYSVKTEPIFIQRSS